MKASDLRKLKVEELLKMKKEIELELVKSMSPMAVDSKDKYSKKLGGKTGQKTSLTRNLKIYIAKINTILREKEIEND